MSFADSEGAATNPGRPLANARGPRRPRLFGQANSRTESNPCRNRAQPHLHREKTSARGMGLMPCNDLAARLAHVTRSVPFSRAPLRRCSCALRTAGFCFFRTPPPKQVRVPAPENAALALGAARLA